MNDASKPIYVTRPSLPPLAELIPLLEEIWDSRILSNSGPCHRRLEAALSKYLGVEHLSLVANATLGLVLALRQLGARGEVITTPFSFVGTGHALLWAGVTPVFADIDPKTLNIDPEQIEAAITPATTAIMPVHCFGRVCNAAAIDDIARRHDLKVIYDAAHAFGVRDPGGSILRHGDLSVVSFHATKVFNTFEGGAVISHDEKTKLALDRLTNYGIVDESTVETVGLNAKLHEFSAALGLVQLDHVDSIITQRAEVDAAYRSALRDIPGLRVLDYPEPQYKNFYSFPILIEDDYGETRDELKARLRRHGIVARTYFSPMISELPMYSHLPSAAPENLPAANGVSSRVLSLPLYTDLATTDQQRIVDLLRHRR